MRLEEKQEKEALRKKNTRLENAVGDEGMFSS